MFLKKNSTYVIDDINDLPIEHLNIGEEVIYLSNERTSRSFRDDSDFTTVFMLFSEAKKDKDKKIIVEFESVPLTSSYRSNEEYLPGEDEPTKTSEYATLDRIKEESRRYLVFPNNALFELERDNTIDDYSFDNDRRANELDEYIHNKIFSEKSPDICLIVRDNYKIVNNNFHKFFYMKLSENSYLTFMLSSAINTKEKQWIKQKDVKIFFRDKTVLALTVNNFEELFEGARKSIKLSLSDNYYNEFQNSIKIHSYDIDIHMKLDYSQKEKMIQAISKEFYCHIGSADIRDMFKPVYVNEEFKLEVYPDTFDSYQHHPSYYVDDKKIFSSIERRESNGPFYEEYRKAKEVFNYIMLRHNVNGINPYDGKLYDSNGQPLEDFMSNQENYFIDYDGIILNHPQKREESYYVRFKDVYVLAYKQTDTEAIDALRKRYEMIKNLDKAL